MASLSMTKNAMREAAREHARQLDAVLWLGVADLAIRWGVGTGTVRKISREALPYLELGDSRVRKYSPDDVLAYEQTAKMGKAS